MHLDKCELCLLEVPSLEIVQSLALHNALNPCDPSKGPFVLPGTESDKTFAGWENSDGIPGSDGRRRNPHESFHSSKNMEHLPKVPSAIVDELLSPIVEKRRTDSSLSCFRDSVVRISERVASLRDTSTSRKLCGRR